MVISLVAMIRVGKGQGQCKMHIHVHYVHVYIQYVLPEQYPRPPNNLQCCHTLMLTYFHCLDTDKLWLWKSTQSAQSYCLKNGRLAPISSIVNSAVYISSCYQVANVKLCCWVANLEWLLTLADWNSSPNIESIIESRVQVLYCPILTCHWVFQVHT